MKKDRRDRIPSADLTAYERWELPLLDERGNEVWVRDEEMDLKPLTAEDLENIRREAWEDGRKEGQEKGYKDGFEMGQAEGRKAGQAEGRATGEETGRAEAREATAAEVRTGLGRLETVMAELLEPLERHTASLETALLNVTLALTRAVIHRELQLDSRQIQAVLKEAVAVLPNPEEAIRIHVNPADAERVREAASRFEAASRIIEDDKILAGGCRVENRNSLVDFTVEKRFQKAVQQMLDRQLQGPEAGEHGEMDALMGELTDFHRDVLETPPQPVDTGRDGASAPAPEPAETAAKSDDAGIEKPDGSLPADFSPQDRLPQDDGPGLEPDPARKPDHEPPA